ncbi:MAG: type II secretion system protein [Clostridia bacterium]
MKNQKGITLIALVVTIVVLLILAGITITYVMSEGGIFNTAKKAADETEIGAIKDYVTSAVYDLSAYAYAPSAYTQTPAEIFESAFPNGSTVSAGTVTATYNSSNTPALTVSISGATVQLPGTTTTYNVSYSAGTITVTK